MTDTNPVNTAPEAPAYVTVPAQALRDILDYLHDSESDHYDPDTYPDDATDHVYARVLELEAKLAAMERHAAVLDHPYSLDAEGSGVGYLTINVDTRARILIKTTSEGIVVDVYKGAQGGDPVASTWAHISDLEDAQLEDEVLP